MTSVRHTLLTAAIALFFHTLLDLVTPVPGEGEEVLFRSILYLLICLMMLGGVIVIYLHQIWQTVCGAAEPVAGQCDNASGDTVSP